MNATYAGAYGGCGCRCSVRVRVRKQVQATERGERSVVYVIAARLCVRVREGQ